MTANCMLFFQCGGLPTCIELFVRECARLATIPTGTVGASMADSKMVRGLAGLLPVFLCTLTLCRFTCEICMHVINGTNVR